MEMGLQKNKTDKSLILKHSVLKNIFVILPFVIIFTLSMVFLDFSSLYKSISTNFSPESIVDILMLLFIPIISIIFICNSLKNIIYNDYFDFNFTERKVFSNKKMIFSFQEIDYLLLEKPIIESEFIKYFSIVKPQIKLFISLKNNKKEFITAFEDYNKARDLAEELTKVLNVQIVEENNIIQTKQIFK